MLTPTTLTIIFIIVSALFVVVMKKIKKDKCLLDFKKDNVTLELLSGKTAKGELTVKNTGLRLDYSQKFMDEKGIAYRSYLLYKNEYPEIQALVRYFQELSETGKKEREKEIEKTFQPSRWRKMLRSIGNFFKIIKDSVIEIANLLTNHISKTTPVGMTLGSQDKQVSKMKNELYGFIETSYEPLLEDYIGERVILELKKGDQWVKYKGILKDYTTEFIEVMDVDYGEDNQSADLIVLRKFGIIRNLSE